MFPDLPYEPTEFTFDKHDESFNSSQLTLAGRCRQAWRYQYLLGVPQRPTRGRTIGSLYHEAVEAHYDPTQSIYNPRYSQESLADLHALTGGRVVKMQEILDHIPRMVEAAVPYLPRREECLQLNIETEFRGLYPHTQYWSDRGVGPVVSRGTLDIEYQRRDDVWCIVDHKTTAGGMREVPGKTRRKFDPWLYVPTPEELAENAQLLVYSYKVITERNVDIVHCRWVYSCSRPDRKAQSKPVDVTVTREHVETRLVELRDLAIELRDEVKRAKRRGVASLGLSYPDVLPPDPDSPCLMYRGCDYHVDHAGPCQVQGNIGQRIAAADIKEPHTKRKLPMVTTTPQQMMPGIAMAPQTAPAAQPQAVMPIPPTPAEVLPMVASAPATAPVPTPGTAVVSPTPEVAPAKPAKKRRPRKKKDETDAEFAARVQAFEAEKAGATTVVQTPPVVATGSIEQPIKATIQVPTGSQLSTVQPTPVEAPGLGEYAWHELVTELMSRGYTVSLSQTVK